MPAIDRSLSDCRYAPSHYWELYPNDTITLPPRPYKPIGAPNIAMQDVMRGWSTPKGGSPLTCKYTDLCAVRFQYKKPDFRF